MTTLKDFYKSVAEDPKINLAVTNVVITDDVAAVEVERWINNYEFFVAKGSAKRDPRDSPDAEIALKLSLGRAIRQLGREILGEGQHLVREVDAIKRRQQEATEAQRERKIAQRNTFINNAL